MDFFRNSLIPIAVISAYIKNQQAKKYFFVPDQKHTKKIKRSIGNNLNRNADSVSLWFFYVIKVFLKISEHSLENTSLLLYVSTSLQLMKKEISALVFPY